jgi:hypothetical protein
MNIIYFLNWFLRWILTTLLGMIFFFPARFEFLGYRSGVSRKEKEKAALIRIQGQDGKTVEVRSASFGKISNLAVFNGILLILTIILVANASMDAFYPAMRKYNSEPELLPQIIIIILALAYLLNLILLFSSGYLYNRHAGMKPVINIIFTCIFVSLTVVYISWFLPWLATTKLSLYFPVKFFK